MRTILFISTLIILGLSLIAPPFPEQMLLQHTATVLGVVFMAIELKRKRLSVLALGCFAAYLWLHIVGARHIYTFTPYNDWSNGLMGFSINELMGWERNQYDRLVHFSFGLLFMPGAFELFYRKRSLFYNALWMAFLSVNFFSMFYELFEWGLTFALGADMAESYNGQQGDAWDAHKDMALALLGSLLSMLMLFVGKKRR